MIYTGLNRTGEIETVKAHGGYDVAEVYGGINEANPIYYKTRTITGQTPLSYKALSNQLSDYLISGNTVQDGTPSPDMPVNVVGCGEKTENLFDYNDLETGSISPTTGENIESNQRRSAKYISVLPDTYYTLSNTAGTLRLHQYGIDDSYYGSFLVNSTFKTGVNTYKIRFSANSAYFDPEVMLNTGSTAKPYEPYGYKLPPTIGGTEYPIYLGQVESTRKVKKLVLTGEEPGWTFWNNLCLFQLSEADLSCDFRGLGEGASCDHLPVVSYADRGINTLWWSLGMIGQFVINVNSYNLTQLKAYLADNPITVWYVLATPTTGIVNEPLMKIGTYADTVSMTQSGVAIPTVAGSNVLDMTSPVKPSSMSITGNIKPIGYGQLLDVNNVEIYDKNNIPVFITG